MENEKFTFFIMNSKITDAYRVYNKYLDYNVIYSAYRTFILSINY